MRTHVLRGIASGLAACFLLGCMSPNNQLTLCQQDKDKLLGTIRQQREAGRALQQQVASLEGRLDQAEKELASLPAGTRLSSRPVDPATTKREQQPAAQPVKSDALPWRSPATKSKAPTLEPPPGRSSGVQSRSASLAALVGRDNRVQVDAASGTAKLELPMEFSASGAALTAQDKRQLDDLARLLKSEEARELTITVAGPTAERSRAVSEYLDSHGIAAGRLSISDVRSIAMTKGGKATNDVQILLQAPNATVAGRGSAARR